MRLAVVLGPFVNLLAPLAFYALAASLFGRAAALAGLCLMLFGKDGALPFWTCAYSPWLLAPMYSMGFLFLTLMTYKKALESGKATRFYLAGLLLGIAFMSHTAPAVIGGGTMLLVTMLEIVRLWRIERRGREAFRLGGFFLLMLAVAFFVSLPYSGPILWRYHFHVLNPWPSLYASQNVELKNLPGQIKAAFSLRNGVALLGLVMLYQKRRSVEARLVACWGFVVCALMVQHYIWQALRLNDIVMTSIVPGHHAAIHLATVRTVLFGMGVIYLGASAGRAISAVARRAGLSRLQPTAIVRACTWTAAMLAGIILYAHNPYSGRTDFKPPGGTTYYDLYERHLNMYAWIRDNTPPEAVFLCPNEGLGIQVVMPAGRKLVNPMLLYCNPYVERGVLTLRQGAILEALDKGDKDSLCREAAVYPMLYMLLEEPVEKPPAFSTEIYRSRGTVLYEIFYCWKSPSPVSTGHT
jgi:hypothetical protein